jgi:hypothetical protein
MLKYPEWQEPLFNALIEYHPRKLPIKLQTAEDAISARLNLSDRISPEERQALTDAMRTIQVFKK